MLREKTNFKDDVKIYGPIGENRLKDILTLRGKSFIDVSEYKEFRDLDIDIIQIENECSIETILEKINHGQPLSDIDAISYEVKTDTFGIISRNIVFEVISNSNIGCLARTKADYLFYVFLNKDNNIEEEYLIPMKKLRHWLMENFGMINKSSYLKAKSMRRDSDNTGIFLVNIEKLIEDKIATKLNV